VSPGSETDAPQPTDGPPSDSTELDAPPDSFVGPPPTACVEKWLSGTPPTFSTPGFIPQSGNQPITSTIDERDPFVSSDKLLIYFSRVDGSNLDILNAIRADAAGTFGGAVVKSSLTDESQEDSKVTMTGDDLIAFIASRRATGEGESDLWEARRDTAGTTAFGAMTQEHLAEVNDSTSQLDPHISPDGLRLYFAAGDPQKIMLSSRTSLDANFGAPAVVGQINGTTGDADPSMTADERVILFTRRDANGDTDLFFATRAERDQPFGTPQAVTFNSVDQDADPMITGDGCTVFFASTRDPGTSDYDLYVTNQQ
jgi:hypothetical protein